MRATEKFSNTARFIAWVPSYGHRPYLERRALHWFLLRYAKVFRLTNFFAKKIIFRSSRLYSYSLGTDGVLVNVCIKVTFSLTFHIYNVFLVLNVCCCLSFFAVVFILLFFLFLNSISTGYCFTFHTSLFLLLCTDRVVWNKGLYWIGLKIK